MGEIFFFFYRALHISILKAPVRATRQKKSIKSGGSAWSAIKRFDMKSIKKQGYVFLFFNNDNKKKDHIHMYDLKLVKILYMALRVFFRHGDENIKFFNVIPMGYIAWQEFSVFQNILFSPKKRGQLKREGPGKGKNYTGQFYNCGKP